MKKVMNTAIVYFVLAMISGVFYREATKLNDLRGRRFWQLSILIYLL